ncbi:unnamed protein product [Penicillium pancosmium]
MMLKLGGPILGALVATSAAHPQNIPAARVQARSVTSPALVAAAAATTTTATTTSTSTTCTAGDTSTTEGVQAILDSTGAIDWLGIMFDGMPKGESDWANYLWEVVFPGEGTSPLTGCGDIGTSLDWLASWAVDPPDQTWAKWISAAFSMAGVIATAIDLSKPLRGMVGFAAAGLTDISLTNTGGDNNTILIDENKDNSSFTAAYDNFADNIEKKLADIAMKMAWYVLVGEEDTKESDCTMTGAYWLEGEDGEYRCFYLSRPENDHDCSDGDPSTCVSDAWQTPYNANNQVDTDFYLNGNDEVDVTVTTNNDQIPRCFYSGYVRSGYWYDDGHAC